MGLESFRPLTPSLRSTIISDFSEVTKSKPEAKLTVAKRRTGGRNMYGRMTSQMMAWAGIPLMKSRAGRVLIGAALGLGTTTAAAEGYALLRHQNDADVSRLATATFDAGILALVNLVAHKGGARLFDRRDLNPTYAAGAYAASSAIYSPIPDVARTVGSRHRTLVGDPKITADTGLPISALPIVQ